MRAAVATFLIALATAPAAAQPGATDPVVAHFRDYRAAIDRQDFAAAETAADAALRASEAANGSRTAVLALNLALLRLTLAEPAAAREPAARAHELATSRPDSGVDPLLASLTLGRAELESNVAAGAGRLEASIEEAEMRGAFLAEAYAAAVTLGDWTTEHEEFERSRAAWVVAERLASEGSTDSDFARGRARLGEGAAIFLGGVNQPRMPSARNNPNRAASADAHAADAAFSEAQVLLRRSAFPAQPTATLTPGQTLFAQAMAWQGALRAKLESQDEQLRDPIATDGDPPRMAGAPPPCSYRTVGDLPAYPADALNRLGAGAVVVHTVFDAGGNVLRREIAAGVPPGSFVTAIRRSATEWRSERSSESARNCDPSGSRYTVIRFQIGNYDFN